MAKQERIVRTYANAVAASSSTTTRDNILMSVQSPRVLAGLNLHLNLEWTNGTTVGNMTNPLSGIFESVDVAINGETSHFRIGTAGRVAAIADDAGHIFNAVALGMGGGGAYRQGDPVAAGDYSCDLFIPINKMVSGSFNCSIEVITDALNDIQSGEAGATTVGDATLTVSAVFSDSADKEIYIGHVAPRLTDISASGRNTESYVWAANEQVVGAVIVCMNDGSTAYSDGLQTITVRDTAGNEYARVNGDSIQERMWGGMAPSWNATDGGVTAEYRTHQVGYYYVDLGLMSGGGLDIEYEASSAAAIDVVTYLVTATPVGNANGAKLTQGKVDKSEVL